MAPTVLKIAPDFTGHDLIYKVKRPSREPPLAPLETNYVDIKLIISNKAQVHQLASVGGAPPPR